MNKLLAATALLAMLAACKQQVVEENAAAPAANAATDASAAAPAGPVDAETAKRIMKERHEGMEDIGDAMKAAGKTLQSGSPDVALIQKSAATIADLAPEARSWFPAGTGPDVGKTHALPAVWEKPDEFAARMKDFETAAPAFHAAAQTSDLNLIKPAMGELGKSCKGCHDTFREKEKDKKE